MGNKIICILIFLCILQGLLFWPFAYFPYQSPLNLLTIIYILITKFHTIHRNSYQSLWIILMGISIFQTLLDGIFISFPFILCYILGILIFSFDDNEKKHILKTITKWFAIIVVISLGAYILNLIFNLSPISILNAPWGYENHKNYFFYIVPENIFFVRFSGPFIEPGHLACFSSFLLFANKYDFQQNKVLWIIFIGIIFSLSLAGYILTIIGFLLNKKIKIKYWLGILLLLFLSHVIITKIWNDGDNIANLLIYERLAYDEDKGIAGNNRIQYNTDKYYSDMTKDGSIFWGRGNHYYRRMYKNEEIGGAGTKIYLIQYGVLGLFLTFLYYFLIASKCNNKKYAYKFLLLLSICFLQRAYPYHIYWLVPYILSLNRYNHNISIKKRYVQYNHTP